MAHVSEEQRRYLARYVVPTLQQGLVVMYRYESFVYVFFKRILIYRTQPDKPLLWLAEWLRKNNPQTSKLDDEGK